MQKINNSAELKTELLKDEDPQDFCILLAGGAIRSSKSIMLTKSGRFNVVNEADDTEQTLTGQQLYTHSNIGEAMDKGAFYKY
jgi:hypothetical protein